MVFRTDTNIKNNFWLVKCFLNSSYFMSKKGKGFNTTALVTVARGNIARVLFSYRKQIRRRDHSHVMYGFICYQTM